MMTISTSKPEKEDFKFIMADSDMLLNTPPPPVPVTAQRHMFTPDSRKALLREVVRLQPYKNPALWDAVTNRYGWWCYKNICPPRRSVPKDRLRKKVKSIIAKYAQNAGSATGANTSANTTPNTNLNTPHNNTHNGNDATSNGSSSPLNSDNGASSVVGSLVATTSDPSSAKATAAAAAASQVAVDEDNLPYDLETLGLIEEVVKQYTESVEMVQARRFDRSRKRDSDVGLGPHSPGSSKSPPADSNTSSSSLRFRPPMTPGSNSLLHNSDGLNASSYSTPLGITDMINSNSGRLKRPRLGEDDEDVVLEMNSNGHINKLFQSNSSHGGSNPRSTTKGTKYIEDILLNSSEGGSGDVVFDSLQSGDNSSHPQMSYFADSVASAASSAIMSKLPELLEAVRDSSEESNKSRIEVMKSFGASFGSAFASSFSSTFEATVNKAVDQIFQRLNESAVVAAAAAAGTAETGSAGSPPADSNKSDNASDSKEEDVSNNDPAIT